MKTSQQRAFEARLRRQARAAMVGRPVSESDQWPPPELLEEREFNQRRNAVKARIDADGDRLPKGEYRSAAEHHHVYSEYQREQNGRFRLAGRLSPLDGEGALYTARCEFGGCGRTFVTGVRQRRFCSSECARQSQREHAAAKQARYEAATVECGLAGCGERFFRLRPDHRYCSSRCRDLARTRKRVQHVPRGCEACGGEFVPKNVRARFCSSRCRVRVWGRQKADREAT